MEGVLDILWDNNENPAATPRYTVIFMRLVGFKNGAQATNHIVGTDALEAHLADIGFTPQRIKQWLEKLHDEGSVSIANVSMPEEMLPIYAN
jgi:hypothetical protein